MNPIEKTENITTTDVNTYRMVREMHSTQLYTF
jgi:hypothetical protein